ncbi:MAG: hypothetical protein R3B46_13160 [Phycisphaerales bacterium]
MASSPMSKKSSAEHKQRSTHWTKLPAEQRTTSAILEALDFDFFELLDSVTIALPQAHRDVLRHR